MAIRRDMKMQEENFMENSSRILEWCGFKPNIGIPSGRILNWWIPNDTVLIGEPVLDMNFFEKYVIPKVEHWNIHGVNKPDKGMGKIRVWCSIGKNYAEGDNDDLNTAWQEALEQLLKATG